MSDQFSVTFIFSSLFRYSLAFLNVGTINGNESFVHGNSFDYGFNKGIGVFGTNHLEMKDNVIYHTVGSCMDIEGNGNRLIRNLMVYSVAMFSYKVNFSYN